MLAVSLAVTALLWSIGLPFFFLFLFIPIIPFLGREKRVKRCPACGWETTEEKVAFCPYDAHMLQDKEKGE